MFCAGAISHVSINKLFELRFRCTDITALQPYLRDSSVFRKRAAKHITNKTTVHITIQRVSPNSAEYTMSARRLPLRLTTTSNSHHLFPAARGRLSKRGGRSNANTSHRPANCPSGGGNCPRAPLTIPRPNCPVTRPNCTSAYLLVRIHASASIARIIVHRVLKAISPHS